MGRASPIQASFAGGEISPLVQGRVDLPRYKESLAICQNYIPLLQGPITRRSGTAHVFPVKDSSKKTRLIQFEFSTTQAYMLEFGNQYIRFFKNNSIITTNSINISGITQASPGVVTATLHGRSNGDHIIITGVLGMVELNNREFTAANVTANTLTLVDNITGAAVDTTSYTAWSSGGTIAVPYEIVSPYLTADLSTIQFTQSNDTIFFAHGSYPQQKLTRTSDTNWTITALYDTAGGNVVNSFQDGPYLDENIPFGTTLTLHHYVAAGPHYWYVFATPGASNDINNGSGFLSGDVGRLLRLKNPSTGKWNWFMIYQVDDNVTARIAFPQTAMINSVFDMTDTQVAVDWRLGLWSTTTGFPAAVVFHENRLVFGGSAAAPIRFDGSNAANYSVFAPTDQSGTISASHSYGFNLLANNASGIKWLTSDEQGLLAGTSAGPWLINSGTTTAALSAINVNARKVASVGSAPVQAFQSGKCTLFIQKGGTKLREVNYEYTSNGFIANDMTQLSKHILKSGALFLAVQKTPQPIMWIVRNDGVLVSMTYERDFDALRVGFARHVLGGTGATVESVSVIPSADDTHDDVWLIVKRTINGQTVRYVEYITEFFDEDASIEDAIFLDASLTYDGASTLTISGLTHLNGQSVSALADGIPVENLSVINGKISLPAQASKVTVGLTYNSDGQKLRSDAGGTDGTAFGKTRRTHKVGLNVLNTLGFNLGMDFSALDSITLDSEDEGSFDEANSLFSGISKQPLPPGYDFDNMICWRQSQPLPGTIIGIYPVQEVQDDG